MIVLNNPLEICERVLKKFYPDEEYRLSFNPKEVMEQVFGDENALCGIYHDGEFKHILVLNSIPVIMLESKILEACVIDKTKDELGFNIQFSKINSFVSDYKESQLRVLMNEID